MVGAYEQSPQLDERGFDTKYAVDDLREFITGEGLLEALRAGTTQDDVHEHPLHRIGAVFSHRGPHRD